MAVTRSALVAPGGAAWQGVSAPSGGFPVSTSARLILDGFGSPWIATGDSAWSIFGQLSLADAETYLDSISAKQYNTILTMAVVKATYQDGSDGTDYLGRSAWTGTAFQSTLNTAYWDHVDDIIEYAASVGVTVVVCPAYIGNNHDSGGWSTELAAASDAQAEAYGGYLGARLKDHPNLLWLIGHDATPNATDFSRQGAIVDGIKDAGDTHLIAVDGDRSTVGVTEWSGWGTLSDVDINTAYLDYDDIVAVTAAAYAADSRPVLVPEAQYQDHPTRYPDDVYGRYQFWGSLLAGAQAGYIAGHYYVHTFQATSPDWDTYLDDDIYTDTGLARTSLDGMDWHTLSPDTADAFLTGGEGTGGTVAAAAYGGSLGVVYAPTSRQITLDLTVLDGLSFTITRVDPTTGTESVLATDAAGSAYVIDAQGTNAGSDGDWLLIVTETVWAGTTYGGWPDESWGSADWVASKSVDESSGTVTLTDADADYTVGVTGFGTTSLELVPVGTSGSSTFHVVDSKRFDGVYKIATSTDNMLLRNCYIKSQSNSEPSPDKLVDPSAPQTIMLDCTMIGGPNGNVMGSGTWHVERCNLSYGIDIARMNSGTTMVNSILHHMVRESGSHNDGIQSTTGGPQTLHRCHIVAHNWDDISGRNAAILSSALRWGDDPGPQSGTKIITDNLINGGSTAVRLGGSSATWTITGNRWLADPELGEGPFDYDGTDPETDGAIYRATNVYDGPTVGTITESDNRWVGTMNVDAYYMGEPDGVDGSAV